MPSSTSDSVSTDTDTLVKMVASTDSTTSDSTNELVRRVESWQSSETSPQSSTESSDYSTQEIMRIASGQFSEIEARHDQEHLAVDSTPTDVSLSEDDSDTGSNDQRGIIGFCRLQKFRRDEIQFSDDDGSLYSGKDSDNMNDELPQPDVNDTQSNLEENNHPLNGLGCYTFLDGEYDDC